MDKIAVIYWSGTGNTELMAQAVAEGARAAGAEADLKLVADIDAATAAGYTKLALGSPAMGAEVLEEGEFEPFFSALENQLGGKPLVLFGSYDWGDGQWMRDWKDRAIAAGAQLSAEPVTANNTPDDEALAACRALGKALAST